MEYIIDVFEINYKEPDAADLNELTFIFDEEVDETYLKDQLGSHIQEATDKQPISFKYKLTVK